MRSLITVNNIPLSDPVLLKNALIDLNGFLSEYGLALTDKQIKRLSDARVKALRASGRIELGEGIVPVLVREFSSCLFVNENNFADVIEKLTYIFFEVKTAVCDRISDKDLVRLMKDFYENRYFGFAGNFGERDVDVLVRLIELELAGK